MSWLIFQIRLLLARIAHYILSDYKLYTPDNKNFVFELHNEKHETVGHVFYLISKNEKIPKYTIQSCYQQY